MLLEPSTSLTHALGSSAFAWSQSLGLWSTHHTLCHSPPQVPLLVSPRICCSTTSSFAWEPKNPHYPHERTPSLSADRSLSRQDVALLPSACCLAVGWLPHHPLAVLPWKDLITTRCSSAVSPWGNSLTIRSPSRCEAAPSRETALWVDCPLVDPW